jgi:hypothetical protein
MNNDLLIIDDNDPLAELIAEVGEAARHKEEKKAAREAERQRKAQGYL